MWKFGPGVVVFIVGPDQEEIGIIVALGIQEQLGLKEKAKDLMLLQG